MSGLFPAPKDLPAEWAFEYEAQSAGCSVIAGVDEVGRGPLAGPVVAAAVVLTMGKGIPGVTDSKKIPVVKRTQLSEIIKQKSEGYALGVAGCGEIDRINILNASLLAMRRAVENLPVRPDFLLIDGNKIIRDLDIPQRAIVKGDSKSISIGAASIIAKVARDRMMVVLDGVFPGYGFAKHMGYATKEHYRGLKELGPCWAHRRTFRGVQELV